MWKHVLTLQLGTEEERHNSWPFTICDVEWHNRTLDHTLIQLGYSLPTEIEGSPAELLISSVRLSQLLDLREHFRVAVAKLPNLYWADAIHKFTTEPLGRPATFRHTMPDGSPKEVELWVWLAPKPEFCFNGPPPQGPFGKDHSQ